MPADNILSDTTSTRLDDDFAAYTAGIAAIATARGFYSTAVQNARAKRLILKNNIIGFYETLNSCIKRGTMLAAVRAYFQLPITNRKMPKLNTDIEILAAAALVLSGNILRVAAGGVAMSSPSIAEFTAIYNTCKPFLVAISNAHTAVNTAVENLDLQTPEIKDLITHVWDEVEAFYSMSTPTARRAQCRLWGVRYMSVGISSFITGNVKDALGVVLADVKVRIVGSNLSVLTDALGNFSLNTTLYGDLELEAILAEYETTITDFSKEDGITTAVDVVMTHV